MVAELRLDLIGSRTFSDGAYLDGLRRFVAEHGLADAVRFSFDVPDAALPGHFLRADALVMPSLHEGFCVPVIEAQVQALAQGADAGFGARRLVVVDDDHQELAGLLAGDRFQGLVDSVTTVGAHPDGERRMIGDVLHG